jgi:hypothetical protein
MRTRLKTSDEHALSPDLIVAGILLMALLIGFGIRLAGFMLP